MSAITIIVPIYNSEKYLDRCINSIINQTFRDIEILLINDGSTDNSLSILSDYADKDTRIRIINQTNKGLSATRNRGIKEANGQYILHVDSDDWIEQDMCEIMYNEAEKHDGDIVTSHVFFEYPNRRIIKKEPYGKICDFSIFLELFITRRGLNSVCNKLIKRNLYILNDIYHYEDATYGEDVSALLRLIVFSKRIITVDRAFYHYVRNNKSMSGIDNLKPFEYIKQLSKVEEFYKTNNLSLELFPLLRYKIAYKLLRFYFFSRKKEETKNDYNKCYNLFLNEINLIINNKLFHKFLIADKLFLYSQVFIKIIRKAMGGVDTSPLPDNEKYVERRYSFLRLIRMCLFIIAKIIPMSGYTRVKIYRLAGVDFENGKSRCGIVCFDTIHPEDIHIGKGCEIVNGCTILSHFYDVSNMNRHSHFRGEIHIGRNVYMGTNAIITKPVTIGDGAVIGAGSIVNKDIPSYQVWAGVPAKFIKNRETPGNPIPKFTDNFKYK